MKGSNSVLAGTKRKTRRGAYKQKAKDIYSQNYESSRITQDEAKQGSSISDRRNPTRQYPKRKRQKLDEIDDAEIEITIPASVTPLFELFKGFVDNLIHEESNDPGSARMSQKPKGVKRKALSKIKEQENESIDYQQHTQKFIETRVPNSTEEESNIKVLEDKVAQSSQKCKSDNLNTGLQSDQTYQENNTIQPQQDLLTQLVSAQAAISQNIQQQTQLQNAFMSDPLQGLTQGGGIGGFGTNSQSLLLLQRIIQTTPEIQMLHQQEQLALLQIQRSVKAALSQN